MTGDNSQHLFGPSVVKGTIGRNSKLLFNLKFRDSISSRHMDLKYQLESGSNRQTIFDFYGPL